MTRFAENTDVSTERSAIEIKKVLKRFGAWEITTAERENRAAIQFRFRDRVVRFVIDLPALDDREFTETPTGKPRNQSSAREAWGRACRQIWRAWHLVIKAKLVAVDEGIKTFESEFLGDIVIPGGQTLAELLVPKLTAGMTPKGIVGLLPAPDEQTD